MELGRSWRTLLLLMLLLRPRGAGELRGHRRGAALNVQRLGLGEPHQVALVADEPLVDVVELLDQRVDARLVQP